MHLHRYSGEFAGNAMHGVGVFETANGVTYWGGYSSGMMGIYRVRRGFNLLRAAMPCAARHMQRAACHMLHIAEYCMPHAPWPHAYEPEGAVLPAMTDPGGTSSRNAPALCAHAGPRPRGVLSSGLLVL
jgi:hypothetical protein